ncbi:MAG TPA: formate dehydrogenase subunit delta [Paracoccaceae bacterium]|nr:formate dehydrogenase subunit delta [Paracoccaceae bacterium]
MSPEKLVRMANQIATFFRSQPREDQVERIAGHLRDFWAPSMRARLAEIAKAGGEGLDPLALAATERLAENNEG